MGRLLLLTLLAIDHNSKASPPVWGLGFKVGVVLCMAHKVDYERCRRVRMSQAKAPDAAHRTGISNTH